jgi:hypothetical protein
MRHILTASLVLSSLVLPAAAFAKQPADDVTSTSAPRISTGVVAPSLIDAADLDLPQGLPTDAIPADAQVGLSMVVDQNGQPQDIHVVKGINPFWDARVVEAVSKFRYHPGSIDSQTIPVDLNLTVNITR